MGHQVKECGICKSLVMEGHNDWDCDKCGAVSDASTGFKWEERELKVINEAKRAERIDKVFKDLPFIG